MPDKSEPDSIVDTFFNETDADYNIDEFQVDPFRKAK